MGNKGSSALPNGSPLKGESPAPYWILPWYVQLVIPLVRLAGHMLRDADDAWDAVHTVFGRLLLRPWPPDSFCEAYLRAAVRKECLQRIRNGRKFAAIDDAPMLLAVYPSVGERIDAERELDRLFRVWTDRQREVCLLWSTGCSYKEIAEQLDVATNTVHVLLQRARTVGRREREERERERERDDNSMPPLLAGCAFHETSLTNRVTSYSSISAVSRSATT